MQRFIVASLILVLGTNGMMFAPLRAQEPNSSPYPRRSASGEQEATSERRVRPGANRAQRSIQPITFQTTAEWSDALPHETYSDDASCVDSCCDISERPIVSIDWQAGSRKFHGLLDRLASSDQLFPAYTAWELKPGNDRVLGDGQIMMPLWQSCDALIFADLRGQQDDGESYEGNWGIGWRQIRDDSWIASAYGFYDLRHTENDHNFSQATFGLEALSVEREVRLNVYIPESGAQRVNRLNRAQLRRGTIVVRAGEERAYYGADAEFGSLLKDWCDGDVELRGFVGGYHFDTSAPAFPNVTGARGRVELRMYDLDWLGEGSRVTVGGELQWDQVRETQAYAMLRVRVPLGRMNPTRPLSRLERRMLDRVVRDVDIVVQAQSGAPETAINSLTGLPIGQVQVVDANGNIQTAATAVGPNGAVIIDGAAGQFNPATGIVMQPGQTLLGGGGQLRVTGASSGAAATFTAPGSKPTINQTDITQNVINLADNTAVVGLRLNGGLDGIDGAGIQGRIGILDNHISNTQDDGIALSVNGSNTLIGEIRNNAISNTDLAATATGEGIEIVVNDMATLDLSQSIVGNTFTAMGSDAVLITANDQSTVNARFADNNVNGAEDDGFEINSNGAARVTASFTNNAFTNVNDDAIELNVSGASTVGLTIVGNQFFGGGTVTNDGIDIDIDGTSQVTALIQDNQIFDVNDIGIETDVNDNGIANLSIVGNTIMGVNDDGINLELDGATLTGTLVADIRNNTFTDISDDGVIVDVNDSGTATINLQGNQFLRTGADGTGDAIEISVSDHNTGDISLTTTITDNQLTDTPTGIRISTNDNDSDGEYLVNQITTITGNTFLRNGTGVALSFNSDSDADDGQFVNQTMISNNSFLSGTGDAINLDVSDWDDEDLTIALDITGNQFMTHGGDAIDLNVSDIDLDTGVVNFLPTITGNMFTGTTMDNIRINVADEASIIGDIRNNSISGGTDGLDISSAGNGPNHLIIGGNSIDNVFGTGILFDTPANLTTILDLGLDNTVTNAGTIFNFPTPAGLAGSQILINGNRQP